MDGLGDGRRQRDAEQLAVHPEGGDLDGGGIGQYADRHPRSDLHGGVRRGEADLELCAGRARTTRRVAADLELDRGQRGGAAADGGSTERAGWRSGERGPVPVPVLGPQRCGGPGADLDAVQLRLHTVNGCQVSYIASVNRFYLLNDAGTANVGSSPPGGGALQNSECTLNAATSTVASSGNTITVTLDLTFTTPGFDGTKQIWGYALDGAGQHGGWTHVGNWTVQ